MGHSAAARVGALACVAALAAARVDSECSMGNGLCQCAEGDTRCNTVKPFFEQSLEVCNSQTVGTCGNNIGYKSCSLKADQSCVATACWLATVDVIAACPEFYPDLSSSPLSVCNTSDVGVYVKGTAYTYTTYEQDRDAEIFGGCTESHGECTERCGTKFNALWDDGECRPWLEAYANRAPVLKDDLKIFVDRCDVRRTGAGSWLLYGALISCLGACMLGTVIIAFKKAEEGTEAEMKNKAGVSLDSVGKHHHAAKMESTRDLAAAKSQDADDDDI